MLKVLGGARIAPEGLSDPAPTSASSKSFMDGMKLSPQGSVYLVSIYLIIYLFIKFLGLFFSQLDFFSLAQIFSFWGKFFCHFFFPSPLTQSFFFWGALAYPQPTLLTYLQFSVIKWAKQRPGQTFLPTTLLPTNPPTSLILPTSPTHLLLHSSPLLKLAN
jgi:hypothetical protein